MAQTTIPPSLIAEAQLKLNQQIEACLREPYRPVLVILMPEYLKTTGIVPGKA